MKFKLMIQSLSPLALLTIIKNFHFDTSTLTREKFDLICFFNQNIVLLCVMFVCFMWIVLAVIYFVSFGAFKWNDKNTGYEIKDVKEDKDAGLNFFLTIIIPLLIDDISEMQGALIFLCILFFICLLLYKTNLFYANPILVLLGYHIYEFSFVQNAKCEDKKYIGLCQSTLKELQSIEYKVIQDNVLYIKGM